jgi:hypothetical protein
MKVIHRFNYDILLGDESIELFDYFESDYIHGMTRDECEAYGNSIFDAYIAGMANVWNGRPFIFINISRCFDPIDAVALITHEVAHLQNILYGYHNESNEEEWVTGFEEIIRDILNQIDKR